MLAGPACRVWRAYNQTCRTLGYDLYQRGRHQAFTWVDRTYRQKDVALYRLKGDPMLKNLEPDARYAAFPRKILVPQ
jgi:hypothetical protein